MALVGFISDMVDRRRFLVGAGSLLLGSGALYQSGAFSEVAADRGVSVQTAADKNGYVGIEGLDDPSQENIFTNNTSYEMDLIFDAVKSGIKWEVDGVSKDDPAMFSLSPDQNKKVSVNSNDDVTFDGTAKLYENGVESGRIEFRRTIAVSVISNLKLSGSVSSSGKSGKFEFSLKNTGSVDVELLELGIIQTTADSDRVSGNGSLINKDTGTELITDEIPINNNTSDSTLKSLNPTQVLDYQDDGDEDPQTITLEFEKFLKANQTNGGGRPQVDMRGEDVQIELKVKNLNDGTVSTAPVDLCSGSCDF